MTANNNEQKTKTKFCEDLETHLIALFGDNMSFAVLMGSADTSRFHEESDIDIALFFKPEYFKLIQSNFNELIEKKEQLSAIYNREIDLILLNKIDPIFAFQVISTGRLIYAKDLMQFYTWKAHQMSVYPDFKMTRKVIENNLLKKPVLK